jgi:hypothetical protein
MPLDALGVWNIIELYRWKSANYLSLTPDDIPWFRMQNRRKISDLEDFRIWTENPHVVVQFRPWTPNHVYTDDTGNGSYRSE